MPISYTIHSEHRLFATRFRDPVTDEEFVEVYREIYADPGCVSPMKELADLREAEEFNVSKAALVEVDRLTRARFGSESQTLRSAIVAPADLGFGLARMYGAYSSDGPEDVSVHRTMGEALEQLGVSGLSEGEVHGDEADST